LRSATENEKNAKSGLPQDFFSKHKSYPCDTIREVAGKSIFTAFRKTRAQWLDILMEIGIILAVYFVYGFLRGNIDAKASVAIGHAQDVITLEKNLGIFCEHHIQSFFLQTSFRIDIANTIYKVCYFPVLIIFAIWGYWRHRAKYKYMRTVFIISAALAFITFAVFPLAPPRFFDGSRIDIGAPNLGFIDTLVSYWHKLEDVGDRFYNPFAAMPSLHQAWTIMVGVGIWWMTKSWYSRAIAVALPVAMFFGIIATGNHFVLDAVGGTVLIGVSFGITALIWRYKSALSLKKNKETAPSTGCGSH
jgi:hypothetical protein